MQFGLVYICGKNDLSMVARVLDKSKLEKLCNLGGVGGLP